MVYTKKVKGVYEEGFAKTEKYVAEPRLKEIIKSIRVFPNLPFHTFLDLGCGDGFYTKIVAKEIGAKTVYGLDISKKATKIARSMSIKTICADIDETDLPLKPNSIDFVLCGHLIELVANADHLLQEIHRVLKKNGKAIISFPNIAAWLSRFALLFGYLPYYSRVSTQFDLGKMFSPIKKGASTGFIRLFNLQSFVKLAELHKLKVVKIVGTQEQALPLPLRIIDSLISKKPSFAFSIICVLTKN